MDKCFNLILLMTT